MQDNMLHTATENMLIYGGGFARAIAVAAQRADSSNLARLTAAFPELFAKYATMTLGEQVKPGENI